MGGPKVAKSNGGTPPTGPGPTSSKKVYYLTAESYVQSEFQSGGSVKDENHPSGNQNHSTSCSPAKGSLGEFADNFGRT